MSLSDDKQADIIDAFSATSRYLDDIFIPAFFFRKKGILISCQSRSVVRPSVCPSVRTSVRHVSCKFISS